MTIAISPAVEKSTGWHELGCCVPAWVDRWVGGEAQALGRVELRIGPGAALASVRVQGARGLDEEETRAVVSGVYRDLFAALTASGCGRPVRVWSYIPGIHDRMAGGGDRYMAFNAGRFEAMSGKFGGAEEMPRRVPAASGVGISGDDLYVHFLGTCEGGEPVENRLQCPAYRYSNRYGLRPPCFARATRLLSPEPVLLVSGTAAIRGEDSVHADSPGKQWTLTLENLRALLESVRPPDAGEDLLARFRSIRVYCPRPAVIEDLASQACRAFGRAEVELVVAELCRPELAVEVEGVASVAADWKEI